MLIYCKYLEMICFGLPRWKITLERGNKDVLFLEREMDTDAGGLTITEFTCRSLNIGVTTHFKHHNGLRMCKKS